MARNEQSLADFAERTAAMLASAGFPRMPARVMMALMAAETGLTAQELSDRLSASAASISGAVRYLQNLAMVHRIARPGSRRDVYELPDNAWYTASLNSPIYTGIMPLLESGIAAAGDPADPAAVRIAEMRSFFRFIQRRLSELLAEWEANKAAHGVEDL
jgi:hypothetical protein